MRSVGVRAAMTLFGVAGTAGVAHPVPQTISFCDLSRHPEDFVDKKVVVWASDSPSLNGTDALFNDNCAEKRSVVMREKNGDSMRELYAYRPSEELKAHPFRIWGKFSGEIVKEDTVSDPLINDDGFHFVVAKVQNVKAVNVPPAVMDRLIKEGSDALR